MVVVTERNLIHRMTVVPVTFASLYQGDGIYVLQISRGEGLNIINPQTAGFTFENTTSNQTILPRGAGDQYYFVLSQMDRYSLKLEGVEVWSHDPNAYPETPKVYPETSEEVAIREEKFQQVVDIMKARQEARTFTVGASGGEIGTIRVQSTENWDSNIFLRDNFPDAPV